MIRLAAVLLLIRFLLLLLLLGISLTSLYARSPLEGSTNGACGTPTRARACINYRLCPYAHHRQRHFSFAVRSSHQNPTTVLVQVVLQRKINSYSCGGYS